MKGFIGKAHKIFNADLIEPVRPPSENRKSKHTRASKSLSPDAHSSDVGFSGMSSQSDLKPDIQDPSVLDIFRYRYHHGTNLGSVYVLERWLSPARFPEETTGTSELEAVKAWVAKSGAGHTKKLLEAAWASALLDE